MQEKNHGKSLFRSTFEKFFWWRRVKLLLPSQNWFFSNNSVSWSVTFFLYTAICQGFHSFRTCQNFCPFNVVRQVSCSFTDYYFVPLLKLIRQKTKQHVVLPKIWKSSVYLRNKKTFINVNKTSPYRELHHSNDVYTNIISLLNNSKFFILFKKNNNLRLLCNVCHKIRYYRHDNILERAH